MRNLECRWSCRWLDRASTTSLAESMDGRKYVPARPLWWPIDQPIIPHRAVKETAPPPVLAASPPRLLLTPRPRSSSVWDASNLGVVPTSIRPRHVAVRESFATATGRNPPPAACPFAGCGPERGGKTTGQAGGGGGPPGQAAAGVAGERVRPDHGDHLRVPVSPAVAAGGRPGGVQGARAHTAAAPSARVCAMGWCPLVCERTRTPGGSLSGACVCTCCCFCVAAAPRAGDGP